MDTRKSNSAKAITFNWFERVWNQQDEKAIYELMHPDCEILGLGAQTPKGPDQFLNFHQLFCQAFDAIDVKIIEMLEQDDQVMGHAQFTAMHRKLKKPVDITFSFSGIAREGQIHQARNVIDYYGMMVQIGALTPEIMTQTLA